MMNLALTTRTDGDRPPPVRHGAARRDRVSTLQAKVEELAQRNLELEREVARRGVKLSCARITLARASLQFDDATRQASRAQTARVLTEKTASIGRLAASVAHELNSPLGSVRCAQDTVDRALEKLRSALEADGVPERCANVSKLLRVISTASGVVDAGTRRAEDVVGRLRSFSTVDRSATQLVDVNAALSEIVALVRAEAPVGVAVRCVLGCVPRILAHTPSLKQAFLNLVHNAITAVGSSGSVEIQTCFEAGNIVVSVSDDGVGIQPDRIPSLFDPQFNERSGRVSAGLGLPICARVVHEHGGEILVKSVPGAGAQFTVRLPTQNAD